MKCERCGFENPEPINALTPIVKLSRDAIKAIEAGHASDDSRTAGGIAGHSSNHSARMLVDLYYTMQDVRKAAENQNRAVKQGADPAASNDAGQFMAQQIATLEDNAKTWLQVYIQSHALYPWFAAVHGIGPVLAAGLAAHLGSRPVPPTVGHWWRYAGLDPSQQWMGADKLKAQWDALTGDIDERTRALAYIVGRDPETVIRDATTDFKTGEVGKLTKAKALKSLARIPFNRPLKTLCWKIGDQFVKLGDREDALYAKFYRNRKAREVARNENGERRDLARKTLEAKPNHAQRAIYAEGKLPDGRIDLMARRATVKLFLSHLHELWYRVENNTAPPHPFSTTIKGHAHYIAPFYEDALFGVDEAA